MVYAYSDEDELHWRRIAKPLPARTTELTVGLHLLDEESDWMNVNLLPGAMEDKWIVLCGETEGVIDFHRSWTGFLVYRAYFESAEGGGYHVRRAIVNREPEQYTETDDGYDVAVLVWLIRTLMCGQEVPFPEKAGLAADDALLAGWAMGGSAAFPDPPREALPPSE